jgi:hypothetical protein
MIFLERVVQAVAVLQTILATLQSSSRALYILRSSTAADNNGSSSSPSMNGVVEGPLILPPSNTTDDSSSPLLWEISTAFRHSVELALDLITHTVHI